MPAGDKSAADLLDFYIEAGADALVGEEPVNRFAAEAPAPATVPTERPFSADEEPRTPRARSPAPAVFGAAPPPPDAAAITARELARAAGTLDDLRTAMASFEGCALRGTATQLVFADGNPQSKIMLVGEAPGRDEDIEGLPFVGRSGQLLNKMLAAIGLDRSSVYIANIIPWRPPGNRTPTPQESAICLPFIERQIELSNAEILMCLGGPSAQTLLGVQEILKARGRWFTYKAGARELRAMPTLHPAYLLRQPLQKRLAWRDFLAVKKALAEL